MFPCVGRRVSLVNSFRAAAKKLGVDCTIVGTDKDNISSALQCCDHKHIVSPIKSNNYYQDNLDVIKKYKVDLVVPTLDTDLAIWASHREELLEQGCRVLISTPEVIDICQDKRSTYNFMLANGFSTPEVFSFEKLKQDNSYDFPYFMKPWDGSAARGNQVVNNIEELEFFYKRIPNCLIQKHVKGYEFTIDAFIDFEGNICTIVPRKRIEVRGGEVVKAVTVKNQSIIDQTYEMLSKLKAGPGVITTQCFLTSDNQVKFIEINPRFGGGVPLSIQAGADFPAWLIHLLLDKGADIQYNQWQEGLMMMRYDSEIWLTGNTVKEYM